MTTGTTSDIFLEIKDQKDIIFFERLKMNNNIFIRTKNIFNFFLNKN